MNLNYTKLMRKILLIIIALFPYPVNATCISEAIINSGTYLGCRVTHTDPRQIAFYKSFELTQRKCNLFCRKENLAEAAAKPPEPAKPPQVAKSPELAKPTELAKPPELAKPNEPAKPPVLAKIPAPAKLPQPVKPLVLAKLPEQAKPPVITKPTETKPTERAKPAILAKLPQSAKPPVLANLPAPAKPLDLAKPHELTKSNELAKPSSILAGNPPHAKQVVNPLGGIKKNLCEMQKHYHLIADSVDCNFPPPPLARPSARTQLERKKSYFK